MVLTLDVGNTRTKWGLSDQSSWVEYGAFSNNEPINLGQIWDRLKTPAKILGSNVASQKVLENISQYWLDRGCEIRWIRSSQTACGVLNGYEKPEQLGTDRWAALIGAWKSVHEACLVVSAGTAMTVDMLDNQGRFMGGQIIPGRKLMLESLATGTHALKAKSGLLRDYPLNTADAMASGIANALGSAVESAFHQLEKMTQDRPACLVTGGDADWLAENLNIECKVEHRLVLEGLLKMAEEDNQP